jgi:hypothetical protein
LTVRHQRRRHRVPSKIRNDLVSLSSGHDRTPLAGALPTSFDACSTARSCRIRPSRTAPHGTSARLSLDLTHEDVVTSQTQRGWPCDRHRPFLNVQDAKRHDILGPVVLVVHSVELVSLFRWSQTRLAQHQPAFVCLPRLANEVGQSPDHRNIMPDLHTANRWTRSATSGTSVRVARVHTIHPNAAQARSLVCSAERFPDCSPKSPGFLWQAKVGADRLDVSPAPMRCSMTRDDTLWSGQWRG